MDKQENRNKEKIIGLIKQKDISLADLKENATRQACFYHLPSLIEKKIIRPYIKGTGLKDDNIFYTFINDYEQPQDVLKLINTMCDTNIAVSSQAIPAFINLYLDRAKETFVIEKKLAIEMQEKRIPELLESETILNVYNSSSIDYDPFTYELRVDKEGLSFEEFKEKVKERIEGSVQENIQYHNAKHFEDFTPIVTQAAKELAYAIMCNMSPGLKEKAAFSLTLKNENGGYNLIDKNGTVVNEEKQYSWDKF
ncbi:MAG: hypothetical protein WC556_05255 [Candidatus Methanoperedens sp.]